MVHGVAELPHEQHPIARVERHYTDRQMPEMDDAVDAGLAVRPDHVVVEDFDPGVFVCDPARHALPGVAFDRAHAANRSEERPVARCAGTGLVVPASERCREDSRAAGPGAAARRRR